MFKWTSLDACSQSYPPQLKRKRTNDVSPSVSTDPSRYSITLSPTFCWVQQAEASWLPTPCSFWHKCSHECPDMNGENSGTASLSTTGTCYPAGPHLQTVYLKTARWRSHVSCADACADDFQIYTKFQIIGSNSALQKYPKFNNLFPYSHLSLSDTIRLHTDGTTARTRS